MSERRIFEDRLEQALDALDHLQAVSDPSDRKEVLGIRKWLWEVLVSDTEPRSSSGQAENATERVHHGETALAELKAIEALLETDHNKKTLWDMRDWLRQILGKGTAHMDGVLEIDPAIEDETMTVFR